jgi:hypothetical protein
MVLIVISTVESFICSPKGEFILKSGKALLVLGLVCVSFNVAAMAEEAPFATFGIRLENTAAQTKEPVVTTPITKNTVSFHIENNTGKAVYFVNGNEKEYIPVVSNATVTAPYSKEPYKVVDSEGKTVASWRLSQEAVEKANVNSASKEQFARWGEQIQQVLQSAQNRSFSYENTTSYESKAEPSVSRASVRQPVKKHAVIRGYW